MVIFSTFVLYHVKIFGMLLSPGEFNKFFKKWSKRVTNFAKFGMNLPMQCTEQRKDLRRFNVDI